MRLFTLLCLCLSLLPLARAQGDGLVVREPPLPEQFDPYALLGVGCKAKAGELKASHRRKRKAVEFSQRETVTLAFEILDDVGRRARWDAEHPCLDQEEQDAEL